MTDPNLESRVTRALAERAESVEVEDGLDDVLAAAPEASTGEAGYRSRSRVLMSVAAAVAVIAGVVGATALTRDGSSIGSDPETVGPEVTIVDGDGDPVSMGDIEVVEVAIMMDRAAEAEDHAAVQALLESLAAVSGFELLDEGQAKSEFVAGLADQPEGFANEDVGPVYRISLEEGADVESVVQRFEALSGVGVVESARESATSFSDEPTVEVATGPTGLCPAVAFEFSGDAVVELDLAHGVSVLDTVVWELSEDVRLERGAAIGELEGDENMAATSASFIFPLDGDRADPCNQWLLSTTDPDDSADHIQDLLDDLELGPAPLGLSINGLHRGSFAESTDSSELARQLAVIPHRRDDADEPQLVTIEGWNLVDLEDGATAGAGLDVSGRVVCVVLQHHGADDSALVSNCGDVADLSSQLMISLDVASDDGSYFVGVVVDQVVEVVVDGVSLVPNDGVIAAFVPGSTDFGETIEFLMTDGSVLPREGVASLGRNPAEVEFDGWAATEVSTSCADFIDGYRAQLIVNSESPPVVIAIEQSWVEVRRGDVREVFEVGEGETTINYRNEDAGVVIEASWEEVDGEITATITCNGSYVDAGGPDPSADEEGGD